MPKNARTPPRLLTALPLLLTALLLAEPTHGQEISPEPPQNLSLHPFTSDGCSIFPNGTLEDQKLWLTCCQKHDYDYWKGGTETERLASDEALRQCVVALGEPRIAQLMLTGVRLGGSPYLPTNFRWGYGWPYLRGYKALTSDEQAQVHKLSQAIEW
ncbi:FAD-binding oxidoreductase [Pseudomaricurvus sp.]|uniref:FAD-binding oxidoreductase n=1 Tax=Pseudomaricurvus sp. TaxID=2004510 RepID=UPI003F6AFED6